MIDIPTNLSNFEIAKMELQDCDESDHILFQFLNENEEIHTDFNFDSNLDTEDNFITEPSHYQWGIHDCKPVSQTEWDKQLKEVASYIADFDPTLKVPNFLNYATETSSWPQNFKNKDIRPRAQDQITKEYLLIDSGAQISVWLN